MQHRNTSYICGLLLQTELAWPVGLSVTNESLAKVAEAERIVMPFGMLTRECPRIHVSDGSPDPHTRRGNFEGEKEPVQDMPRHIRRSIYSKRLIGGCTGTDADWGVAY